MESLLIVFRCLVFCGGAGNMGVDRKTSTQIGPHVFLSHYAVLEFVSTGQLHQQLISCTSLDHGGLAGQRRGGGRALGVGLGASGVGALRRRLLLRFGAARGAVEGEQDLNRQEPKLRQRWQQQQQAMGAGA